PVATVRADRAVDIEEKAVFVRAGRPERTPDLRTWTPELRGVADAAPTRVVLGGLPAEIANGRLCVRDAEEFANVALYGSPHTPLVSGHDKAMAVVRSGGSGRRGGPEHRRDEHGDPSRGQHQPTGRGTPTVFLRHRSPLFSLPDRPRAKARWPSR